MDLREYNYMDPKHQDSSHRRHQYKYVPFSTLALLVLVEFLEGLHLDQVIELSALGLSLPLYSLKSC